MLFVLHEMVTKHANIFISHPPQQSIRPLEGNGMASISKKCVWELNGKFSNCYCS